MTNAIPPKRVYRLNVEVDESQREELQAAWQEILDGKRTRMEALAAELEEITERARVALEVIATVIRDNPTTGQGRRLVHFLAGLYNGHEYRFDLTDLRPLDTRLANACLDYLNYDRLAKAEVHKHLPGGAMQLHHWIEVNGIFPTPHLKGDQAARLQAMAARTQGHSNELLRAAVDDLLARHEAREFGSLIATASRGASDQEEPLAHAHRRSDETKAPLCGAAGGPWTSSAFSFERITCPECKDVVLGFES